MRPTRNTSGFSAPSSVGDFVYLSADLSPADVVRASVGHDGVRGMCAGRVSLLGVAGAAMDAWGAAFLCVATWVNHGGFLVPLLQWFEARCTRGVILAFRAGIPTIQPEFCRRFQATFGSSSLRSIETHAEVALLQGDGWQATIRGSGDMHETDMMEWFDLDLRRDTAAAHQAWFDAAPVFPPMLEEEQQLNLADIVRGMA